jgi:NADPH:quinone reductase-like Zn-dependent oxidoreductase
MDPMMQALVPDPHARGRVRMAQVPAPTAGDGEVVIDVRALSINRGETFQLQRPAAGWRPGKDVAGVVVATGRAVDGLQTGMRVVAHAEAGGWADRVAVAADRVARLPAAVDWPTAAPLGLAGLTALRLTRVTGPLASRRVLLTGASGGVGHAFVQLAAAHGAEVTAVTRDPARGARLLELGAVRVVTAIEQADGPFEIAIESTGATAPGQAWARLTPRGHLVWLGQASGEPAVLDFFDWRGATSGTMRRFHYAEDDTPVGVDLAALVRLVASGRLHVEVGLVADWTRTGDALEALLERDVRGNAVLTRDPAGARA